MNVTNKSEETGEGRQGKQYKMRLQTDQAVCMARNILSQINIFKIISKLKTNRKNTFHKLLLAICLVNINWQIPVDLLAEVGLEEGFGEA